MNEIVKFLEGWGKVRQNLIATAEDMPEEHYDTAPFEGIYSFRKQLGHVLHTDDVLFEGLLKGAYDPATFRLDPYAAKSKQELLAALQENFRAQSEALRTRNDAFWSEPRKSFDGSEKTAGELLQMMKEHEISHLNQLYIYLRAKGIVPPTTRKKAAARAARQQ